MKLKIHIDCLTRSTYYQLLTLEPMVGLSEKICYQYLYGENESDFD